MKDIKIIDELFAIVFGFMAMMFIITVYVNYIGADNIAYFAVIFGASFAAGVYVYKYFAGLFSYEKEKRSR